MSTRGANRARASRRVGRSSTAGTGCSRTTAGPLRDADLACATWRSRRPDWKPGVARTRRRSVENHDIGAPLALNVPVVERPERPGMLADRSADTRPRAASCRRPDPARAARPDETRKQLVRELARHTLRLPNRLEATSNAEARRRWPSHPGRSGRDPGGARSPARPLRTSWLTAPRDSKARRSDRRTVGARRVTAHRSFPAEAAPAGIDA